MTTGIQVQQNTLISAKTRKIHVIDELAASVDGGFYGGNPDRWSHVNISDALMTPKVAKKFWGPCLFAATSG